MRFILLSLVLISLNIVACRSREAASTMKEYSEAEIQETKEIALDIPVLKTLGISYKVFQNIYKLGGDGSIDVRLGKISAQQCETLKQRLYDNKITCAERSGMDYELSDFLPPMVNALTGKTFHDEYVFKNGTQEARNGSIMTNCWNTAYEFLRVQNGTSYEIFYLDPKPINKYLADDKTSDLVATFWTEEEFNAGRSKLKTGDYILLYSNEAPNLSHAAIYIDGQVLFQKFSVGQHPIGLVAAPTMFATYRRLAETSLYDTKIRYDVRRLKVAPEKLPAMSVAAAPLDYRRVSFTRDEATRRWELAEEVAPPETATVAEKCEEKPIEEAPVFGEFRCTNNHYQLAVTKVSGAKYAYRLQKLYGDRGDVVVAKPELFFNRQSDSMYYFMDKAAQGSVSIGIYLEGPNRRCAKVYVGSDIKGGGRVPGHMKCEW